MGQLLLILVVALTVAAIVFGVAVLVTGGDSGLAAAEPDDRSVPLPGHRPLLETDVADVRFDTAVRGYRMAQVDQAMRRAAYDIGYKEELIGVLEAEVTALREGRTADAETLRRARLAAVAPAAVATAPTPPADAVGTDTVASRTGDRHPSGPDAQVPADHGTATERAQRSDGTTTPPDPADEPGVGSRAPDNEPSDRGPDDPAKTARPTQEQADATVRAERT
jgi:DivIVA domain-containing protein